MLIFWLIVMWLAPIAGCLLSVFLVPHPNVITAALGAFFGLGLSVAALLLFF